MLAGLLPDLDAALYLGGPDLFLRFHQLYTHNIVAMVVLPFVVASALTRFTRATFSTLLAVAYAATLTHITFDLIGLWPVPLAFPFSTERWALFLLEEDFAWPLDAVLVLAAVLSFWDPVATRPWVVRGVAAAAVVVMVLLLPWV